MLSAVEFERFRYEAKILSKTMKKNSARITKVKNLPKKLCHSRLLDMMCS